jgi:hypothetical protein
VIPGVSAFSAFVGGVSAIFGPEMLLVILALACGGLVMGSKDGGWRSHVAVAAIFAVVVSSVWLRADLVPPARFSRWLALIPLLGLAEIRRLRMPWEHWMAPAIAFCTAALALLWRMDRYGPVLASLRGDWQQPLSHAPRWLYHFGTALSLGLVLFAFGVAAGRIPSRLRAPVTWSVLAVAFAVVVFGLVGPAQRWLLLHGPPLRVG